MSSFSVFVGRRYTGSIGQSALTSFVSKVSMFALMLSVAILLLVMSVMNGFEKEMQQRILGLIPHVTVQSNTALANWEESQALLLQHAEIVSVKPYARLQGMLVKGRSVTAAALLGLDVASLNSDEGLTKFLPEQARHQLLDNPLALVLGKGVARKLKAEQGDVVNFLVPRVGLRGEKMSPLILRFNIAAIVSTGTEFDDNVVFNDLTHLKAMSGGHLYGGLQVSVSSVFEAPRLAWEVREILGGNVAVQDWTRSHGNLYSAIELSRRLIAIMLLAIIGVAVFNIVASLVMAVNDKSADIAILRTQGASTSTIIKIFMVQGTLIGFIGTMLGLAIGLGLAAIAPSLISIIEQLLGLKFLSTEIYPVDFLPIDVRMSDVLWVSSIAVTMSFCATLYPSWRAARLQPARVLNNQH